MNITKGWEKKYFDKQVGSIYKELSEEILKFLELLVKRNRILDLGCGDGKYSFFIGREGYDVLGIDISQEGIKIANNHKKLNKIENVNFKVADIANPKLPQNSFDAISLINSYHCLTAKQRIKGLNEIKKILKKGGLIFISALFLKDQACPRIRWKEIEENTFEDEEGKIFHFFTEKEIKNELTDFKILKFKELIKLKSELGRKSALFIIYAKKI